LNEEEQQKKMKSQFGNLLCDPVSKVNKNKLQPIEKRKAISDTGIQQSPQNKTT